MTEPDERSGLGAVAVHEEADTGFLVFAARGNVHAAQARRVLTAIYLHIAKLPHSGDPHFVLIDIRGLTGVSADARHVFASAMKASGGFRSPGVIATFGGSSALRLLANGILTAMKLVRPLSRTSVSDEYSVHADEQAARAWLAHRKLQYSRGTTA